MIVDANAHVEPSVYDTFEFDPTFASLTQQMDEVGIDRAVVSPLKPPSFDFDTANDRLAARTAKDDRFYGIGRIDPRVTDCTSHVDCALTEYELHGIKLNPYEETYSIVEPFVDPVLEIAAKHTAPVWIEAGIPPVSHALSIREVAHSYPELSFVLTHGAHVDSSGLSLPDVYVLAEETTNTYFELSGVYRRDFVLDIVETVGAERVMFGTNAPFYHPAVELARVTSADLSDDEKTSILGESIKTLL